MVASWFNLAMLATESQQVIALRLAKLAWGGSGAREEARTMLVEKVNAAHSAGWQALLGHSPDSIVTAYREKVRANVARLSAP